MPGVRWQFIDYQQSDPSYSFETNPNVMDTPHRQDSLTVTARSASVPLDVTKNAGTARVIQGKLVPLDWTFGGVVLSRSQYLAFNAWLHKGRRIHIVDHFDRTWAVLLTGIDWQEAKKTPNYPWRFHYTFHGLLYGRVL